jgi:hypothetical protein
MNGAVVEVHPDKFMPAVRNNYSERLARCWLPNDAPVMGIKTLP